MTVKFIPTPFQKVTEALSKLSPCHVQACCQKINSAYLLPVCTCKKPNDEV